MAYPKGAPRPPGSGRAKGTPNKTTRVIRDVLTAILEEPASEKKLRELRDSQEPSDRSTFWRLAGRLVPNEIAAKVEMETRLKVVDLSDERKDDDGLAEG